MHFGVRLEDASQCLRVLIGATADGTKELRAILDGYRESAASGKAVLLDVKPRGRSEPKRAVGDGALGFWNAWPQVFGHTKGPRCWEHKTVNVLHTLPKSQQPTATAALPDIWMAAHRHEAEQAFDRFQPNWAAKYPQAAAGRNKDRDALRRFYEFPAEHWVHIRTTHPIESTCATVRLRTHKTRGGVSRDNMQSMVCMLGKRAERGWRTLKGAERWAEVVAGGQCNDGVREEDTKKIAAYTLARHNI